MTAKLIETNCRQCNKVLTNDSPDGIYCDEKCGLEVFEISHSYFELVMKCAELSGKTQEWIDEKFNTHRKFMNDADDKGIETEKDIDYMCDEIKSKEQ